MARESLNPLTDDRLIRAKRLYDEGASINKIRKETGLAVPTIHKYIGKRDPTPGGGGGRPRAATKHKVTATDEQLTSMLTKVAVAPAIPMGLWLHCDFCANHFTDTGPDAAAKLVELSRDNAALRSILEALWRYGQEAAWATLILTYFGIPVAHHLAPDYMYRWLQMPLGLPSRNGDKPHTHARPPTTDDDTDNPFAGMDLGQLLATAERMGMPVDMSAFSDAPGPTTAADDPTGPTEATAGPAADVAASAPDTNAAE